MKHRLLATRFDSLSKRDLLLKLAANRFSKLSDDLNFDSDIERYQATTTTAIAYLKETGQYRKQLQLCLKNFAGRTAETFQPEFISAVRQLYQEHLYKLGQDVINFSELKVNRRENLDIDFDGAELSNVHFSNILENLFYCYAEDVLSLNYAPGKCKIARIYNCSKDTMNRVEGKLRTIGQFACLDDAITFLKIRIGLNGKYSYKLLVDNLDELINDFLIDSSNGLVNRVKAKKPVDELVREASNKYEILNYPTYLINPDAYKAVLRHRIKAILKN